MADITNLTGYTWVANEKLEETAWVEHSINFTTKDKVNYTKFIFYNDFETFTTYLKYNDEDIYSFEFQNEHWIGSDDKKSFTITGGDDATSLILIGWLQDNGTLIPPITDLTEYKWTANDVLDDSIMGYEFSINFTSNSNNYNKFAFINDSSSIPQNSLQYDRSIAYSYDFEQWSNQNYKTIIITGGSSTTNTKLINWMATNGTLVKTEETNNLRLGSTEISGLHLGSDLIKKIYLGEEIVYKKN